MIIIDILNWLLIFVWLVLFVSIVGLINTDIPHRWYINIRTNQIILFIVLRKLFKGEYK